MRSPSVLLITRTLQPSAGGMQAFSRLLIDHLRSRGDCSLSVLGHRGGKIGLPFFGIAAALRSLLFRGDRVHLADAALSPLLPLLRVLRPGLKRSITVHGLDLTYPSRFYQWVLRRSLPAAQRVVAVSRATAAEAVKRGAAPAAVVVIPCGISSSTPPLVGARNAMQILILGRQIPRKGTAWFLREVFPRLLERFPHLRLVIAGDGLALPAVRRVAAETLPACAVTICGNVSEEEKRRLFETSTLFLMPNIPVPGDMEGFGLTCIEAGSYGLPVVAAKIEGVADAVLEGETGLCFCPGDPDDAVGAVERALTRPWDRSAVRAVCLRHFSIDAVASRYVSDVFR